MYSFHWTDKFIVYNKETLNYKVYDYTGSEIENVNFKTKKEARAYLTEYAKKLEENI